MSFMPCGVIATTAGTRMARMVLAQRVALARRVIIRAIMQKQVRTRRPADGDARAAGRTGQEGEEPGPKRRAKAQTGTATTAVGETAKDRAGGQKTSKGFTDKGRATGFGVSEQSAPLAFFEADGMASASFHTDSSSGDACVPDAIRVDCSIPS